MSKTEPGERLAITARVVSGLVIVLTIAVLASFAVRAIYNEVAICLVGLAIFTDMQFFLNRRRWLRNPPVMQLFIAAIFFIGLTAGRFFSLYQDAPGFDKLIHLLDGAVFSMIGYALFYRLNPNQQERLTVTPVTLFILVVSFAATCGFLWEIFEFGIDRLLGVNMQRWREGLVSGLNDTMFDMVADLLGAVLVCAAWLREQRRDPDAFYRRRILPFLPLPAADRNGGKPSRP